MDELPPEAVASDQGGDVCAPVAGNCHVVLHLQIVFVRDAVLPFPGLESRRSFGLKDAGTQFRMNTGAVQIGLHEGVLIAPQQFHPVFHLDAGALGEFSTHQAFQLGAPVGGLSSFLSWHLIGLFHPQFHRGLVPADPADHGSIRSADPLLAVVQPVRVGHGFGVGNHSKGHGFSSHS